MAELSELRPRRDFFVDAAGTGMRVTWHERERLFVLSLWRDDQCVEAFRLDPDDAARLVHLVTTSLASVAAPAPSTRSA